MVFVGLVWLVWIVAGLMFVVLCWKLCLGWILYGALCFGFVACYLFCLWLIAVSVLFLYFSAFGFLNSVV